MFKRLLGILTFNPEIYRTVAASTDALEQAGIVVIFVALLQSLFGMLKGGMAFAGATQIIFSLMLNIVLGLVIWVVISWLLTAVATAFGKRMGLVETLRVAGFVQVFGLLSIVTLFASANPGLAFLDLIAALAIAFLSLYGYYLIVHVISGLPVRKALLTAIFASLGWWAVIFLIDRFASAVLPILLWRIYFIR